MARIPDEQIERLNKEVSLKGRTTGFGIKVNADGIISTIAGHRGDDSRRIHRHTGTNRPPPCSRHYETRGIGGAPSEPVIMTCPKPTTPFPLNKTNRKNRSCMIGFPKETP